MCSHAVAIQNEQGNKVLRSIVETQCFGSTACAGTSKFVIDRCTFVENENTYEDHVSCWTELLVLVLLLV